MIDPSIVTPALSVRHPREGDLPKNGERMEWCRSFNACIFPTSFPRRRESRGIAVDLALPLDTRFRGHDDGEVGRVVAPYFWKVPKAGVSDYGLIMIELRLVSADRMWFIRRFEGCDFFVG